MTEEKRKPGRPPKPSQRKTWLYVGLLPSDKQRLQAMASDRKQSHAAFARRALLAGMARLEEDERE